LSSFDGQAAAQAAIALRRAGLKPALERTFHWGEETHGLVVAQEPGPGSEVPLDSTVLLFVSAPGERGETNADAEAVAPSEPAADTAPDELHGEPQQAHTSSPTTRRRRKPRPDPVLPAQAAPTERASLSTSQDQGIAEEHASEAAWADEDPLLPLAEQRLADAPRTAVGAALLRPSPTVWSPLVTMAVAALTFVVTLLVVLLVGHAHALQAAGAFKGTPISGVQTFVDKLRDNLVWLGGTAMGLVIAVVGIMFMAGHSRAHDLAIRTIVGLAILASISGIVA